MGIRKNLIIALAAFATMLATAVGASAQGTITLKAVFQDSSNGDPVGFATVSLTKAGAKNPAKYVLTDSQGKATIDKITAGTYTLKTELLGYKPYTKEIKISQTVDLGVVKMDPDAQALDAASVSATGNPIVMKKDTIEYNASSFKTSDNDMLIDLLKKLPGVEVSEDGSVTANGETISKITIDGKTFFLDDPQLATKNIPAKLVEKVKVVNKKSEQAEFTGIEDGNDETIIDLSVQKGMMHGLVGNVMAGGGYDLNEGNNDFRYQGNAFIGRFNEDSNFSIILNGNNTNNRGFNDMAGSMMQGMRGGGGGMGQGGGGWGSGNGITTSWMGGLNGNVTLFDDKMDLGGNYLYNGSQKYIEETSDKITSLDTYKLLTHSNGSSTTNTDGHRFGMRLEHKFSDNTSILFQPQVSFGAGDYSEGSESSIRRQVGDEINNSSDSKLLNTGDNKSVSTEGFFLFRQRLGIPGRTFSFNARYNFSNNDLKGFNQSRTSSYDEEGFATDSLVNQRFVSNQKSASLSGRATYTEPLGGGFYVEGNYELSWNKNTTDKNTWDSGAYTDPFSYNTNGQTLNDTYSNDILNRYINQSIGANFMYQKDGIHAQVGFGANPTNTHNETNGQVYDSKVVNWAPQAMVFCDFNENTNMRIFYRGSSSQPTTSQLMPVPDNTNPLSVSFGNPYLEPYFSHSLRGEFRLTNKKTFFSFNGNINASYTQDPIVNATWFGTNGAQYSIPINGHDQGSINGRLFLNSPIAKSNFSVSVMANASYSRSSSYVGSTFDTDKYYSEGNFDYELFHSDFADLDKAKEFNINNLSSYSGMGRLRLTYRNDIVELTATVRSRASKATYSYSGTSIDWRFSNQAGGSMNWTIPGGISLISDVNYNWYVKYTTDQPSEVIINAEIDKLLFRKKFTLALKGYDLMNQSKNLSITDQGLNHTETLNNTLGRYIILSLTYRFGTFGGRNGRMGGGPGRGMGGPGGGPMGGGPMGGGRPPM